MSISQYSRNEVSYNDNNGSAPMACQFATYLIIALLNVNDKQSALTISPDNDSDKK
jgi:hypothetical protein